MQNQFIALAYKMYVNDNNERIMAEEAPETQPFTFITGFGMTLPKFEQAVEGLAEGEEFKIEIDCENAFGQRLEEGVQDVPKSAFEVDGKFDDENIVEGAILPLMDAEGNRFYGMVMNITDEQLTIDLNHPFAGKDLTFEGHVMVNRDATPEEIEEVVKSLSHECDGGCDSGCCGGCH